MNIRIIAVTVIGTVLISGCTFTTWDSSLPEKRPLGANYPTYTPRFDEPEPKRDIEEPLGELTLRQALALALVKSPELASFAWGVRQAEAERLQASLLPNPEVETEFENFAGSGESSGTKSMETTIAMSQLIELGGKRRKRMELARLDSTLVGWDYEARRIEVLTTVAKRFVDVLAVQEKIKLAAQDLKLAEATLGAVDKRIAAGRTAPTSTNRSKAYIEVATSRIALRRLQRTLSADRYMLAATWGSKKPLFSRAAGSLSIPQNVADLKELESHLSRNPAVARWDAEKQQRQAQLDLAKAGAVPDVTAGVGYRHMNESDDHAMVASVSVPLPVFDRNQGEISKARSGIVKASFDRHAAEVKLRAELEKTYQEYAAAHAEAVSLRDEVLPAAKKSFKASQESVREGKSSFLDILDSQRTLISIEQQFIDSLAACHHAIAEIEGLTGRSITAADEKTRPVKGKSNVKK